MKQIKKLKNFIVNSFKKVKSTIESHRRYMLDMNTLLFNKRSYISKENILLLSFIAFLLCVIFFIHTDLQNHKDKVETHLETIETLKSEINDKKYKESEFTLYYEIGVAMLEKNCGKCTKESVCEYIDYLTEQGVVWYPEMIKSCAQIESGFGNSNVGRNYNNLFGMDHPTQRKTLSLYRSGRFATFKNWKCSVLDRVLWDYEIFNHIPTRDEYYRKMHTKYNIENPNYKKIISNCATKYKKK